MSRCTLPNDIKAILKKYVECHKTKELVRRGEEYTSRGWHRKPMGGIAVAATRSSKHSRVQNVVPVCEKGLEKMMEDKGYGKLGVGAFRSVYSFGGKFADDCAVKIARNPQDRSALDANAIEAKTWRSLPRGAKRWFAPVESSDKNGLWLTQKRVRYTLEEDEDTPDPDEIEIQVSEGLAEHGLRCFDLHAGNIGMMDKGWVVLDYGGFLEGCDIKTGRTKRGRVKLPSGQMRLAQAVKPRFRRAWGSKT